jgi:hypothetical protein
MALTLAEAKVALAGDKVYEFVIDEFLKSPILDLIPFDDCVVGGGLGQALTYSYNRVTTPGSAAVRALNEEYIASEAKMTRYNTELAILGGDFQLDRVIINSGNGIVGQVQFQLAQKAQAATALFHDLMINGDSADESNQFDGLDKAINGTSTEYNADGSIDLSSTSAIDSNYKAFADQMDEFLSTLLVRPDMLIMNSTALAKIKAVGRRLSNLSLVEVANGMSIPAWDGILLVDAGWKPASTNPIVPISTRNTEAATPVEVTGATDIYAVKFGLDAFHAVSPAGQNIINVYLPDMTVAGAVKTGGVEMVASVALKATKAAGVFRNIKVQ